MTVVFNRVVGGHVYRVRVVHRPEPTAAWLCAVL